MLVCNRMTKEPVTIGPEAALSQAKERMEAGRFHRVPVVSGGKLVGILTDRDIRAHLTDIEQTKVGSVMTQNVRTVSPSITVEEAAQILLKYQIGGLPVVDQGRLVGIITASDVMKAFLDVMGASEGASTRIDFILEGEEHGLVEASRVVSREGGEILGIGTYREKFADDPVCYMRLIVGDADRIAKALRTGGFNVLGIHRIGGS